MVSDTIHQKILPNHLENITLRIFSRRHAGTAVEGLTMRLADEVPHVGLSMQRGRAGTVEFLALATCKEILIISLDNDKRRELLTHDTPFENLLRGDIYPLVGFDMGTSALRIAHDLKLNVRGIDLSTAFRANNWDPPFPSNVIKDRLFPEVDVALVDGMWINEQGQRELGLRAWLSAWYEIACLGELVRQAYVLDRAKPKETSSEFTNFQFTQDGMLKLQNSRYKTRLRTSNQTIIMTNQSGREFYGQARKSKGRTTNICFTGEALSGTLDKVRVFGPPPLTNTEKARDEFILGVLQGKFSLKARFIQMLWFPSKRRARCPDLSLSPSAATMFPGLNASQTEVASRMVSDYPLVIVHGPPGTGKTTTIAAAVSVWAQAKLPTWIIAHSNVAVKNMAETLFRKEVNFRILVSKEFHFEWHEHIYNEIQGRVIVSDEILPVQDISQLSRILGPTCIMLSTLGMLSNPLLDRIGMFRVIPVERLVVDEASQIKIEDFMHILHLFRRPLKKLCFFGDPKQLPPFGRNDLPEIKTIFDLPHLQESAGFLDTQYRMPVPLGHFISRYVYKCRLKSEHSIKTASCVSFVDVSKGEESRSGVSWTNDNEIHTMINLVRSYYKHTNFCIITPYDAQRSAIERQLKAENLPWEYVFNVDSFQGNEADFVLVSVVRSGAVPGFLSSRNRMNVLLTRCRKGIVIVTSRSFIRAGGKHTLLGSLEQHWSGILGNGAWVDWRAISEGTADLPTAPGPNRAKSSYLAQLVPEATSTRVAVLPVQKTFDVKTLFRPRPPIQRVSTAAIHPPVYYKWSPSSVASFSSTYSSGTETLYSAKSTVPWSIIPRPLVDAGIKSEDADFPALPMIDISHAQKKPSLSSYSLRQRSQTKDFRRPGPGRISDGRTTKGYVVRRLQISVQQIARAHPDSVRY
ncbi:hypothetical protein C0991_006913 [Blastosporella zonata]|nr:hypothetical protein C0991_006913 [Blastosporella zonata]